MSRPTYYEPGPGEGFGIQVGDDWSFDVVPARNADRLSAIKPTRLAVVEGYLADLEIQRRYLNAAIARAKRLRRAWMHRPTSTGDHP
jgi:hypothetical protein